MRTAVIIFLFCVASAWAQYSVPNLDPRVNDLEAVTDALDVRVGAVETGKAALVHSHVVGDVTGLQDALDGKVGTNDTRQLDFTGADILIADATKTNHPVTKAQLDGLLPASPVAGDLMQYDGANWVASAKTWLDEDMVVYFYPTNTQEEIQATINAIPKNLNGKILYLAWHPGTYSFSPALNIADFHGGTLVFCTTSLVYSTLTTAYTNQSIIFQNDGFISETAPVEFRQIFASLIIYDSKFKYVNTHTNKAAALFVMCNAQIAGSMFESVTTNSTYGLKGFHSQRTSFDIRAVYFNNSRDGACLTKASYASFENCQSGPVRPQTDVFAAGGLASIPQTNLTVRAGGGGLIINQAGAILP